MSKRLLDTNIIIRFLVNDDPQKVKRIERLLKNTSHKNILLDTVIAEIIWVLGSYYALDKKAIIEKVAALIHVSSIECNTILISKALSLWEKNTISYIDAYLAAVSYLGNMPLYTYDKRLMKVSELHVKEP